MNGNAEMLNFIYQNSQMGKDTLGQLLGIVKDEKMLEMIRKQEKGYTEFNEKARDMLNMNGYDEKKINTLEKITSYIMINMQTMMNHSSSHIAEMMLKGSNMGIIDAVKHIHRYEENAEKDIVALMKKLLNFEEKNVESLKEFL